MSRPQWKPATTWNRHPTDASAPIAKYGPIAASCHPCILAEHLRPLVPWGEQKREKAMGGQRCFPSRCQGVLSPSLRDPHPNFGGAGDLSIATCSLSSPSDLEQVTLIHQKPFWGRSEPELRRRPPIDWLCPSSGLECNLLSRLGFRVRDRFPLASSTQRFHARSAWEVINCPHRTAATRTRRFGQRDKPLDGRGRFAPTTPLGPQRWIGLVFVSPDSPTIMHHRFIDHQPGRETVMLPHPFSGPGFSGRFLPQNHHLL